MLRSMTAEQFYEWLAFERVEPFGEPRADARMGMLIKLIANFLRDRTVHPTTYTLEDCVPIPTGDSFLNAHVVQRRQTWQQMKAIGMIVSSASWENN